MRGFTSWPIAYRDMIAADKNLCCKSLSRSISVRVILTETEIAAGVAQLARRISVDYEGRPLTVLGVLTGSLIFLSDLIRRLNLPLKVGLVQASSYRGLATS